MSDKSNFEKKSQVSSSQSIYVDSGGKEFSAQDIVSGYKPKKPYKLTSLSKRITSEGFGKVKK